MKKERIVIIDGNSLINRAYYAMKNPMTTKEGIYTQGIYGFLNMLYKILDDYDPDYIAVCWDKKAPTFRHKQYADYKAGRKKMPPELAMQLPLMKDLLDAMNIRNLELEGYEADDLIGTIARVSEEEGKFPLIITGDKDSLQLVSDRTSVLITRKGISEFDYYDEKKMDERYGLTPSQFIDLKGLMGDSSDNIPGVPGIGEKTGIKLLSQFGTMDKLLENTDRIEGKGVRKKIEDNIQLAILSRKLSEIDRFVPIEISLDEMKKSRPDYERLIDLFVKLEFNSFLKRLDHNNEDLIEREGKNEKKITPEIEKEIRIGKGAHDPGVLTEIPSDGEVYLKVFSDFSHTREPEIYGISLVSGPAYYYVDGDTAEGALEILKAKNLKFIGHDLKGDYYVLMKRGFKRVETAFDTAIAQYVIESNRSNYSIKTLYLEYCHGVIQDDGEVIKENVGKTLLNNSAPGLMSYGKEFLLACHGIKTCQEKTLREEGLMGLCEKAEFPLIEVLASMEKAGFRLEEAKLKTFGQSLDEEILELTEDIYSEAGEEFNINSPKQLGIVLFEKLGLPPGKKTKTGYSTDAKTLKDLEEDYPIARDILSFRSLSKLKNTYVDGLMPLIANDGKIHAHFMQTITSTGRISCTEPNLQNIPIRIELGKSLRKAFIPDKEDHVLIGADYSQIELRILAALSEDENMLASFRDEEDIHRRTASRVFNIPYSDVTAEDRSRAKAVNFGIVYGISGFGLSQQLGISPVEASGYIRDYYDKHPAVKTFMDEVISSCREKGYTETVLGRRRYIPEINSRNKTRQKEGERFAMNSPIQGSAADIIKLAMVKVYRELKRRKLKAELILQVHDELIIDTPEDEADEVSKILVENMEKAIDISVNLKSDLSIGKTWYDI